MPLPLSRSTTYLPRSQVRSADLNDIQDAIVRSRHGLRRLVIGPSDMLPHGGAINTHIHNWSGATDLSSVTVDLPMAESDRIRSITVYGHVSTAAMMAQLIERDVETFSRNYWPAEVSPATPGPASWGMDGIAITVGTLRSYYLEIGLPGRGSIHAVSVVFDRPLGATAVVGIPPLDPGGGGVSM